MTSPRTRPSPSPLRLRLASARPRPAPTEEARRAKQPKGRQAPRREPDRASSAIHRWRSMVPGQGVQTIPAAAPSQAAKGPTPSRPPEPASKAAEARASIAPSRRGRQRWMRRRRPPRRSWPYDPAGKPRSSYCRHGRRRPRRPVRTWQRSAGFPPSLAAQRCRSAQRPRRPRAQMIREKRSRTTSA